MNADSAPTNVVLVHGAFVDGSTWRGVYDLLAEDGYRVAVVQNPTLSLQGDAAETGGLLTRKTDQSYWWGTRTGERSSPRPGPTTR
jgi:hypothetical protein